MKSTDQTLAEAAAELAAARSRLAQAKTKAIKAAKIAHKAGMTEVDIASQLGVDRARTLRRWLGK